MVRRRSILWCAWNKKRCFVLLLYGFTFVCFSFHVTKCASFITAAASFNSTIARSHTLFGVSCWDNFLRLLRPSFDPHASHTERDNQESRGIKAFRTFGPPRSLCLLDVFWHGWRPLTAPKIPYLGGVGDPILLLPLTRRLIGLLLLRPAIATNEAADEGAAGWLDLQAETGETDCFFRDWNGLGSIHLLRT